MLTEALVAISTQPQETAARRAEIRALLDDTLRKKGVTPLTRHNALRTLRHTGKAGLQARLQAAQQLMSNTQQAGLVVQRDYLHLSRALFAVAGSLGALYEGDSKRLLLQDLSRSILRLPLTTTQDVFHREIALLREQLAKRLPLPTFLRQRLAPQVRANPFSLQRESATQPH